MPKWRKVAVADDALRFASAGGFLSLEEIDGDADGAIRWGALPGAAEAEAADEPSVEPAEKAAKKRKRKAKAAAQQPDDVPAEAPGKAKPSATGKPSPAP